jgi:hypothetical protein
MNNSEDKSEDQSKDWIEIVSKYNKPDPVKSWWQILNSVGPYIVLWVLMIKTIGKDIHYFS